MSIGGIQLNRAGNDESLLRYAAGIIMSRPWTALTCVGIGRRAEILIRESFSDSILAYVVVSDSAP